MTLSLQRGAGAHLFSNGPVCRKAGRVHSRRMTDAVISIQSEFRAFPDENLAARRLEYDS